MSMFISGSSTSTASFGKVDFAGTGNRTLIKYTNNGNANLNVGVTTNEAGSGGQFVIAGGSTITSRIATFQVAGGAPRLGIGVDNPINSSLAISAPADNDIQLDVSSGGNGYYGLGMASSGQHRYLLGATYSANTSRLSITMGGLTTAKDKITIYNSSGTHYVGINKGATNPAHSLDVSGSIVFANGTQAVQISGSSTSTGSFGRVEGTKLAAGDNFINSNRLRIQTTSRHFGVSGNSINMTANGNSVTSGAYNIIVGRLNIGHTYSVIDFGRHSATATGFRVQHHVSEAGTNPWGILNPNQQTLSMFDNSGSLFLNHGDVSGSITSTGSFGDGRIAGRLGIQISGTPRGPIDVLGSAGSQGFYVSTYGTAVYLPTDIAHSGGGGTFDLQPRNFRLGTNGGGAVSIYPRFDNRLKLGTTDTTDVIVISSSTAFVGDQDEFPSKDRGSGGDWGSGTMFQVAKTTNSVHQFGQTYANLRSEPAGITLGRHGGLSTARTILHQDSGSGAGIDLGTITYVGYSAGGGSSTFHNAARISVHLEDNPSTNTLPGTIDFRTMESYTADTTNPRTRMSVHGGSKAGEVTIFSGSLTLKDGNSSSPGNVSGSITSTGSFGHLRVAGEVSTQLKLRGSYTSTIKPYIRLQPNGSNSVLAFDGNNAPFFRSLSGIIFERRNDSSNQFYRYHAYFEYSTGRSYFGGSTMIHTNGSVFDAGDPKALLHVSGGNFYVEAGNISGSSSSTGSFGALQVKGSPLINGNSTGIGIGSGASAVSPNHPFVVSNGASSAAKFIGNAGQVSLTLVPNEGNTSTSLVALSTVFSIRPGGTNVLNALSSGRVGIGTTSPTNKLHINHDSSTSLGLYVAHSANEYSGLAKFYTNSSNNTARSLVEIHNDNANSTAIIPLKITQDANGTAIETVGSGYAISGSSTSTGSFGSVFVGDINNGKSLSIGDNTRGTHKIYDSSGYLRIDSYIMLGAAYIYAHSDINLDPGANFIRLGSSSGGPNTVKFKTDGSTDGTMITKNHITASGNFSSSLASTGSFGRIHLHSPHGLPEKPDPSNLILHFDFSEQRGNRVYNKAINFLDTPAVGGFRSPSNNELSGHGVYYNRDQSAYSLSVFTGSFHTDSPSGYALALSGEPGGVAQTGGSHAKIHYNGASTSYTFNSASMALSVWARKSGSFTGGGSRGVLVGPNQNTGFLQIRGNAIESFIQYNGGSHTRAFSTNNPGYIANDGKWHHYVLTYDMSPAHDLANPASGSVSLYIDGKKQPQTFDVHKEGNSHGNGFIHSIGRDYASNGHGHWPGDIADVRFYGYESGSAGITDEEIKWLYLNPGEGGQIQGDPETNPRYQGQNIGIGYRTVGAGHIMDDMVDGEVTDFRLAHSQTGVLNVGVGSTALEDITEGSKNVGIGWRAGYNITTGTYNVAIGGLAGDYLITGDNNTYIGHNADASATGVSSEIVIAATPNAGGALHGGGTETIKIGAASDFITNDFGENATWTHSSDRRIKKNIEDNTLGLDFINKLKTRNFKKKAPSEYPEEFDQHSPNITERKNPDKIHYGFVAQEVKEAMDEVGHSEFPVWKENTDGMQELGETELITPLVKAVQELTEIVKSQQEEIEKLKKQ